MKLTAAVLALAACLIAGRAAAQDTTYTFTSPLYTGVNNVACAAPFECGDYTTAMRAVISVTLSAPLGLNELAVDRSASVVSYTFSDGVRTTTGHGPNAAIFAMAFGSDAAGLPNNYSILVERTPGPPYNVGNPADPFSRWSYVLIQPAGVNTAGNTLCTARSPVGVAANPGPGRCSAEDNSTRSFASGPGASVVARQVAAVPTLSEWAMILLGLVIAGSATLLIQRRQRAA